MLERAGVAESDAALILGHATGRGFTFSVYSPNGPGLPQLAAEVARIAYPGLDLSHKPVAQRRKASAQVLDLAKLLGMASPRGLEPLFSP